MRPDATGVSVSTFSLLIGYIWLYDCDSHRRASADGIRSVIEF